MAQSLRYPTTMGVKERWWTFNPALQVVGTDAFFGVATAPPSASGKFMMVA